MHCICFGQHLLIKEAVVGDLRRICGVAGSEVTRVAPATRFVSVAPATRFVNVAPATRFVSVVSVLHLQHAMLVSVRYMCVLILLYVSSYCYICVLILLYMCPHTAKQALAVFRT